MAIPIRGLASQTPPTPGQAVNALSPGLIGGYINNPITNTQNLYVDPTQPASTNANGTTMILVPGQTFHAIPNSTLHVSVASQIPNHPFIAIQWS
jgi:hypothetical protein